jgi:hypothetical protein
LGRVLTVDSPKNSLHFRKKKSFIHGVGAKCKCPFFAIFLPLTGQHSLPRAGASRRILLRATLVKQEEIILIPKLYDTRRMENNRDEQIDGIFKNFIVQGIILSQFKFSVQYFHRYNHICR